MNLMIKEEPDYDGGESLVMCFQCSTRQNTCVTAPLHRVPFLFNVVWIILLINWCIQGILFSLADLFEYHMRNIPNHQSTRKY
jgi:hypothetical protein